MKAPFVLFLLVGVLATCVPAAVRAQTGPEKGARTLVA